VKNQEGGSKGFKNQELDTSWIRKERIIREQILKKRERELTLMKIRD
jgi:hypothetical protein